jgi:hypothetical protein
VELVFDAAIETARGEEVTAKSGVPSCCVP